MNASFMHHVYMMNRHTDYEATLLDVENNATVSPDR